MAFIFNGFLPKETQLSLEANASKYANAIYAKDLVRLARLVEGVKLFKSYPAQHEDCMGASYTTLSYAYCLIRRDFHDKDSLDGFLLLRSQAEHKAIVETFPDQIIDANPFKTVMGT